MQDLDVKWILHRAKFCQGATEPKKCIYSVVAQETAKHRAKFGWPPVSDVAAVKKARHETCWNLLGCPKQPNRSQPLVGWSSPYYEDVWRTYCCLTSFFPIVDICLSCKDTPQQSCAMVHRWWLLASFLCPVFERAACSMFQTCILNSH